MEYQVKELKEGVKLHLIHNDKFKTNLVSIFITSKLTREDVTKNALIPAILRRGSKNMPTQKEISEMNNLQNAIMITEKLLTSKGFNKNVIFVNGDSISVIIGKEELKTEEVAQIQNIVSRELKAEPENIHISAKWKRENSIKPKLTFYIYNGRINS